MLVANTRAGSNLLLGKLLHAPLLQSQSPADKGLLVALALKFSQQHLHTYTYGISRSIVQPEKNNNCA